jgi:hypothetical protein
MFVAGGGDTVSGASKYQPSQSKIQNLKSKIAAVVLHTHPPCTVSFNRPSQSVKFHFVLGGRT